MAVCESCIAVAEEEGVPEGAEDMIMREMGADIADHLCDEIESGGDTQCACACHPRKRSAGWRGKNRDFTSDVIADVYKQVGWD